jgi:dihydrofolate reductase
VSQAPSEHDPEKWTPAFGQRSCSKDEPERDDPKINHPAPAAAPPDVSIPLFCIVAVAENGVIGRANGLPWRLKSDLQHFRALTLGRPVLMGRKTFLSIGRPLPKRTNIVVTRDHAFAAHGVVAAPDIARALAVARSDALRRGADSIAVIGGAEIFRRLLPLARRLELTLVHAHPEGDVVLPDFDRSAWREVSRTEHPAAPGDSASYAFIRYERRTRLPCV